MCYTCWDDEILWLVWRIDLVLMCDCKVSSPSGNSYHYGDHVESGNFAFTAAEAGDYSACFWVPDSRAGPTVTIDFDWRTGVAAKDWSKVAKKGQIEVSKVAFLC